MLKLELQQPFDELFNDKRLKEILSNLAATLTTLIAIKNMDDNNLTEVYRISAVTLLIKNMKTSCSFYSQIPGFKLVYGGSSNDTFTTFEIGEQIPKDYLNLELYDTTTNNYTRKHFGRIIFHTENVDKLYLYMKSNSNFSNIISFEEEPRDASWGERYFHIREPDGYQLSFAMPIKSKN